jgi:hypothetical protein
MSNDGDYKPNKIMAEVKGLQYKHYSGKIISAMLMSINHLKAIGSYIYHLL